MWLKRQSEARKLVLKQLGSLESQLMERTWDRGAITVHVLHPVPSLMPCRIVPCDGRHVYALHSGCAASRALGLLFGAGQDRQPAFFHPNASFIFCLHGDIWICSAGVCEI